MSGEDTASGGMERCSGCGGPIPEDRQPLYKSSDVQPSGDGQLELVDDPDGPFCGVPCRRDYDGE